MLNPLLRLFYNPQRQNQKMLKPLQALVHQINQLEPTYQALSDAELSAKTDEFRQQLAQGVSLDSLLVPAFATVREASRRVLGMRHFDVQLIGGMVLHRGMIAEMKTGEGKTLVATLPVYLNALSGKGVHVVTVNDYLATRDSSIMTPLYTFLGMSVGCIVQDLNSSQRYAAYHADITYGTNNEFGFDFLRDNMRFKTSDMCQRDFHYAIVDEVDSILIDEARTPLIISGQAEDASNLYQIINAIILKLSPEHFEKDEKNKNVYFTEAGYEMVEQLTKEAGLIGDEQLFQPKNLSLVHHLNQSLRAQKIYYREIDYIVRQGEVILIDEFTGRMMKGRRFSDGLHQALEAKEHVEIEAENQTLASITFQNYFRMYTKLSGMTGTAETEAAEFQDIYKLPVLTIPTNVSVQRRDLDDEIFRTFEQKKRAIIALLKECHGRKQPVLVGTLSIEKSEIFAQALQKEGLVFHVLNARHHEKEANIIAQAGVPGAITIATNMAGRGTDIKLGGHIESMLHEALEGVEDPEERAAITHETKERHRALEAQAREAGGLFVLGTERNENRRVDNQLRGRSGRQGDPGASKFFISLEDDLMRIFGPNLKMLDYSMQKSEQKNDQDPMTHPWLTRSIEKAQQRIEAQHFDTRKHLLKYADVLNAQRSAVYAERRHVMDLAAEDIRAMTKDIRRHMCDHVVRTHWATADKEQQDSAPLLAEIHGVFGVSMPSPQRPFTSVEQAVQDIRQALEERESARVEEWGGEEAYANTEKYALLRALDQVWIKHLNILDQVRSGIHLQAYGQKDPLNEYRHEAFALFHDMKAQWHATFLQMMLNAQPQQIWHDEDDDEDDEEDNGEEGMSLEELLGQWGGVLQQNNPDMTEDEWEKLAARLLDSSDDDDDATDAQGKERKSGQKKPQKMDKSANGAKRATQRVAKGKDSKVSKDSDKASARQAGSKTQRQTVSSGRNAHRKPLDQRGATSKTRSREEGSYTLSTGSAVTKSPATRASRTTSDKANSARTSSARISEGTQRGSRAATSSRQEAFMSRTADKRSYNDFDNREETGPMDQSKRRGPGAGEKRSSSRQRGESVMYTTNEGSRRSGTRGGRSGMRQDIRQEDSRTRSRSQGQTERRSSTRSSDKKERRQTDRAPRSQRLQDGNQSYPSLSIVSRQTSSSQQGRRPVGGSSNGVRTKGARDYNETNDRSRTSPRRSSVTQRGEKSSQAMDFKRGSRASKDQFPVRDQAKRDDSTRNHTRTTRTPSRDGAKPRLAADWPRLVVVPTPRPKAKHAKPKNTPPSRS